MLSASLGGLDFFGPATTSPWELPWAEPVCDLDPPESSAGMVHGLDLAHSLEVRGLRLGMTLREADARFHPSDVLEAGWCGRQTLEFDFSADLLGQPTPVPQGMEGVRRLRLGFLDGRLAYFGVTYYREAAPLKPDEFRRRLSESLHLPGKWRKAGSDQLWDQPYSVGCEGLVVAGYFQGPYIEMHDTAALDRLLGRRAEARLKRKAEAERERRGRIFKP